MSNTPQPKNQNDNDSTNTRVDVSGGGWKASVVGSALAVIAVIAIIGMIIVSTKSIDLGAHAIDKLPGKQQVLEASNDRDDQ